MPDGTGAWRPPDGWPAWLVVMILFGPAAFRTAAEQLQWLLTFVAGRRDRREASLKDLLAGVQRQLDRAELQLGTYEGHLAKLRSALLASADTMVQVRDAALAAQLMVHQLQDRLDIPRTAFPPLPTPPDSG